MKNLGKYEEKEKKKKNGKNVFYTLEKIGNSRKEKKCTYKEGKEGKRRGEKRKKKKKEKGKRKRKRKEGKKKLICD